MMLLACLERRYAHDSALLVLEGETTRQFVAVVLPNITYPVLWPQVAGVDAENTMKCNKCACERRFGGPRRYYWR